MKKGILMTAAIVASVTVLGGSASATTVENNRGSIVKIQGSCRDLLDAASNNRGSIVKIEGDSQCYIDDVLKEGAITNNRGSVITITNVCGKVDQSAITDNRGSVIKVETNEKCDSTKPTTVKVEDKTETKTETEAPKVEAATKNKKAEEGKTLSSTTTESNVPAKETTPDAMPQTGAADVLAAAGAMSVFGYIASRMLRKHEN